MSFEDKASSRPANGCKVMTRCLVVDPQTSGISGDMFLSALVDLADDVSHIVEIARVLPKYLNGVESIEVTDQTVTRSGIKARRVEIRLKEKVSERSLNELLAASLKLADYMGLKENLINFITKVFSTLEAAERKIHGDEREVHLHELGSADTVIDVVGSAIMLQVLNLDSTIKYSTPIAVGGGLMRFSHGTISAPSYATLEILRMKKAPMLGGPVSYELSTPTGVAILVSLVDEFVEFLPPMKPYRVGYGGGARDIPGHPNVLRIVEGELLSHLTQEYIVVLETNVDDVTGEAIGYVVDKLMREGALDVSVIPALGKKGRPAYIVKVLCPVINYERLCKVLLRDLGTLGVRISRTSRIRFIKREVRTIDLEVNGIAYPLRVKIVRDDEGRIVRIKPEHDDIVKIAKETSKPLLSLYYQVSKKLLEEWGHELY